MYLREERLNLGYSISKMQELLGCSRSTFNRWESGDSAIPSNKLSILATKSFDVHYILTGNRVKINQISQAAEAQMVTIIAAVETAISQEGASITPQTKAKLITYLFEECETEKEIDNKKVIRALKLVS